MPDTYNYADYYGADPWGNITQNERPWYDPILRDMYYRQAVFSPHVQMRVEMAGAGTPNARTIYFNDLIPPRPNIAPINARQMEASRLYTDSWQRSVTTRRYGNGMSLHKESQLFSYWQRGGGGTGTALLPIIQQGLGQALIDHLDLLARNAFYSHPYPTIGIAGATGVGGLSTSTDKMTTDVLDAVWLRMRDRNKPYSALPVSFPTGSELICITTAGVVHDLKREVGTGTGGLNFVDSNKYVDNTRLLTGELGMWRGVRFVDNGMSKLWNAGTVIHQTTIKSAVVPGQGAPDPATTKVETVRMVGQPAAVHYIEVNDASGFAPNDVVTIHKLRLDSSGVTAKNGIGVVNGLDWTDPMAQTVEIHSVDTTTTPDRIVLKEPYMMTQDNGKGLETDLGGTVFGYVTKGVNVHMNLFLNPSSGQNGVIAGVAQPPTFIAAPPNDDFMSMYRIAYEMWLQYQLWEPRAFEIVATVGANGLWGALYH